MAEKVLTPGVTTKEIDLSQPTFGGIRGVPAGIIGTATKGPAFVPVTFGNINNFVNTFGEIKSNQFGALAARQWLNNASACTFVKVLGIGDGKQRNSDGTVTNAGFFVGDETIQPNGAINKNPYANHHATASIKGRTYFLGCFMSESNGSTIFSDAGIQQPTKKMTNVEGGITGSAGFAKAGANTRSVILSDGILAYTGTLDQTVNNADSTLTTIGTQDLTDSSATSIAGGIKTWVDLCIENGLDMHASISSNIITLTARRIEGISANGRAGIGGYAVKDSANDSNHFTVNSSFSNDASGGAVPILRGVLLAASGVVLTLSGNNLPTFADGENRNDFPANVEVEAAVSSLGSVDGIRGCPTGSYHLKTRRFRMLMNGFKGSDYRTDRYIDASFDMVNSDGDTGDYFASVFNTDPNLIEEHGHVLYSHYDIYGKIADVTGSGVYNKSGVKRNEYYEDIAFLLTSSLGRGESPGTTSIPDYEDFKDRYTHAETPYIISQNYAGKPFDLFKLVSIHSGESIADKYKCSIQNLQYRGTDKYPSFDLTVTDLNVSDLDEGTLIESYTGLTLDKSSPKYISRIIGDQHTYFDFDNTQNSQKIVVEGSFPVRSPNFRVKLSSDLENGNIPVDALPFGFRGPNHLVTSGSFLSSGSNDSYSFPITETSSGGTRANPLLGVIEPPIPYRKNLTTGLGNFKSVNSKFKWGLQSTLVINALDPNEFDQTIVGNPIAGGFTKHFPTHRKNTTNFSVGNNHGAKKIRGQVVDSDKFNFNKFSLHNVNVKTGSFAQYGRRADPSIDAWVSASYNRKGIPTTNHANKTRGFNPDDLRVRGNITYAKFNIPIQGGFNGTNIFDKDKSELGVNSVKREIDDSTKQGGLSGPTISAYRKAIDILGSKTDADIQLLTIPGQRHPTVTDYAISAVENRFDALLVMDIEEKDQENSFVTGSNQNVSITNTVTNFRNRGLDSSFAAAYFPDLNLELENGNVIQVPPSVAVMGALGVNDLIGNTWTAPAGVNRTMLRNTGITSLATSVTQGSQTDALYDADINPIVSLPRYGITIFGQKTLLQNQSALDRINVRRLLIDIRRKVRNVANTLLFEPNREETLEAFTNLVNPILQEIRNKQGLKRFKVVIDTTTTTQADVENNTIRGKIFLEPTRAAEFIALDFVVTNAGAEI